MSTAVLEGGRRSAPDEEPQSRLFEDVRRELRVDHPPGSDSEEVPSSTGASEVRGEPHPRSGGDRLTLERQLERIWEGLVAAGAAECPVCGGGLELSGSQGVCGRCGSALR